MTFKQFMGAAATIALAAGLAAKVEAADALDQASPFDLTTLNEVRTGVGLSGADAGLTDFNTGFSGGISGASEALTQKRGGKEANAAPAGSPYVYCAVRDFDCAMQGAFSTVEQGASAAVNAVGPAIGGAIDPGSIQDQSFDNQVL